MWVRRPRLTHTTSQGRVSPRGSHHHWHLLCTRTQTSRRCEHARRRSTPTPRGDAQTTHTARAIVLCVPFGKPTCPQSNDIERNQAGMQPQQRKHIGPAHHMARTHQTDDKSKGRKKKGGTSAKGSVLILTCVPLPHLVLPLSGCACSGTPTMATRGEARGHP